MKTIQQDQLVPSELVLWRREEKMGDDRKTEHPCSKGRERTNKMRRHKKKKFGKMSNTLLNV